MVKDFTNSTSEYISHKNFQMTISESKAQNIYFTDQKRRKF